MEWCVLLLLVSIFVFRVSPSLAVSSESTPLYLRSAYPLWEPAPDSPNSGERLLLTPYLDRAKLEEARTVARVGPGFYADHIPSYSGYLTVDRNFNSNLFFWFFPTQDGRKDAPTIMWLQGGPGASSLYGLFEEVGPFTCIQGPNGTYHLKRNPFTWNHNNSLLFIDNPVGTGFSYTDKNGYATNFTTAAEHLYKALKQFFKMFPDYVDTDFYISGESYAGKYIPSLAYKIHQENEGPGTFYINLKGITLGNAFTDPESMMYYSDYLYQLGLIDGNAKKEMQMLELQGRKAIQERHFVDAFYAWSGILSLFIMETRFESMYYAVNDKLSLQHSQMYVPYVQLPEVRRALHVGDTEFTSLGVVYYKMIPDLMSSAKLHLESVLDHYRVLFYNGQFDIICAYPLALNLYNELNFDGSTEYRSAKRKPWHVNGKLAGYVKTAANFTEIMVRNAGHMVPADQPEVALQIITTFTRNAKFN